MKIEIELQSLLRIFHLDSDEAKQNLVDTYGVFSFPWSHELATEYEFEPYMFQVFFISCVLSYIVTVSFCQATITVRPEGENPERQDSDDEDTQGEKNKN